MATPYTESSSYSSGEPPLRSTKVRNRLTLACVSCHKRRVKCNRCRPCESCIQYGTSETCTYPERPNKRRVIPRVDQGSTSLAKDSPIQLPAVEETNGTPERQREASIFEATTSSCFTERLYLYTEAQQDEERPTQQRRNLDKSFPISSFKLAANSLPTFNQIEVIIRFFIQELDWLYLVADYESMNVWMFDFLERIKQPALQVDDIEEFDSTRLSLILSFILCAVQIASEGLIKVFFLLPEPTIGKKVSPKSKKDIMVTFERHLCEMLELAMLYDGGSPDLIRANMTYYFYLKNEMKPGKEKQDGLLLQSISLMIRVANLQLDPPISLPQKERESQRRLFWSYYIFDRIACMIGSKHIMIHDAEITTKEPQDEFQCGIMGKRMNWCHIYKARLFTFVEGFLIKVQTAGGISPKDIQDYEVFLQGWLTSLPNSTKSSLPRLDDTLRMTQTFDLERHLLISSYYITQIALHRHCLFKSERISLDQVNQSRQICIDSAVELIKIQERLRMRLSSDHHLRCIYVPLFTLESSITLALAALIEISGQESDIGPPSRVDYYMAWAFRGRDLLHTIPVDFPPTIQAIKLVSRVLLKASNIIDLHRQGIAFQNDDEASTFQDVLRSDIPLIEQHYAKQTGNGIESLSARTATAAADAQLARSLDNTTSLYFQEAAEACFPSAALTLGNDTTVNNDDQWIGQDPTLADFGLEFFNEWAATLRPSSCNDHQWSTMTNLDDQMDSWQALLQAQESNAVTYMDLSRE